MRIGQPHHPEIVEQGAHAGRILQQAASSGEQQIALFQRGTQRRQTHTLDGGQAVHLQSGRRVLREDDQTHTASRLAHERLPDPRQNRLIARIAAAIVAGDRDPIFRGCAYRQTHASLLSRGGGINRSTSRKTAAPEQNAQHEADPIPPDRDHERRMDMAEGVEQRDLPETAEHEAGQTEAAAPAPPPGQPENKQRMPDQELLGAGADRQDTIQNGAAFQFRSGDPDARVVAGARDDQDDRGQRDDADDQQAEARRLLHGGAELAWRRALSSAPRSLPAASRRPPPPPARPAAAARRAAP